MGSTTEFGSRLKGRVAIITGSTQGIGFAIARRLAIEGAKVVISSRKIKNVDNAVKKLKDEGLDVTGIVCHVAKAEDRKKLFEISERLGGLDILVSNAGTNPEIISTLHASESAWDKTFEVNVKAAFLLAKESLPQIRKSKHGRIIFMSSLTGYQCFEIVGAYAATKTALLGLTKAAANQLAPENITVNCVAPGPIRTRFGGFITESNGIVRTDILSTIPLGRFGEPDDVSGAVAFLASDDASFITGESIVIAGGMHARL